MTGKTNSGKVIAYMAVLFLAGAAVGSLITHRLTARPKDATEAMRQRFERLNLTADQHAKIDPLLNNAADQMQTVRVDMIRKLLKISDQVDVDATPVLTPEQSQKLQELEREHLEDLHRRRNFPLDTPQPKNP